MWWISSTDLAHLYQHCEFSQSSSAAHIATLRWPFGTRAGILSLKKSQNVNNAWIPFGNLFSG
jgi:hypothetical protein